MDSDFLPVRGRAHWWRRGHVRRHTFLRGALVVFWIVGLLLIALRAHARDLGQWEAQDPAVSHWYRTLKQPDNPDISCCGEADAYYADSFAAAPDGSYIAIITDTRDDAPLRRPHVEPGTKIKVPNTKIKFDQGNPTGHGVIFLGIGYEDYAGSGPHVYCYCPPVSG